MKKIFESFLKIPTVNFVMTFRLNPTIPNETSQVFNEFGFKKVLHAQSPSNTLIKNGTAFFYIKRNRQDNEMVSMNLNNNGNALQKFIMAGPVLDNSYSFENRNIKTLTFLRTDKTSLRVSKNSVIKNGSDFSCENYKVGKDIQNIEISNGNSIETFYVKSVSCSETKWAMKATSRYTEKSFLFIDSEQGLPIQIDVTDSNGLVINSTHIDLDWYIQDFYSFEATDYVVIHSKLGCEDDLLCIFEICDGVVVQIIYDTDEQYPLLNKEYIFKRTIILPETNDVLIIKERHSMPKFEVALFSGHNGEAKTLKWKTNLNDFLAVTTASRIDANILIGGTSKNGGYLGFNNPHIKILNISSGKVIEQHYIPCKFSTIKGFTQALTDSKVSPDGHDVADDANGDIFILCGLYENDIDEFNFSNTDGIIIRDYLYPDGSFQNKLFNGY